MATAAQHSRTLDEFKATAAGRGYHIVTVAELPDKVDTIVDPMFRRVILAQNVTPASLATAERYMTQLAEAQG